MKLIRIGNYSFKWFFTTAVHFELKKLIKTFSQVFFLQNQKNLETEIFAFYDIAPQPIKIQIRSESQNDRLDFSFLKDIYAIAKKWLERGVNR